MKRTRKALFGGLLLASAIVGAGVAEGISSVYRVYQPAQGLSYNFGSKLAVGYFTQKDGACALNVFLAENTGDSTGPSSTRVQVKVAPGESIRLTSAENQALDIKCADGAAQLEVKGGSIPARYASR